MPITLDGHDIVVYLDILMVPRDRAEMTLSASNAGAPFDRAIEVALARKMNDQLGTKAG
jgi:hypothetical protein